MDRVGRKPLMLTGIMGCCACLIIGTAVIASFASPVPNGAERCRTLLAFEWVSPLCKSRSLVCRPHCPQRDL